MKGGLSPEYLSYIHSKQWRVICKRIRDRDKMCQGCGTKKHLDVHHKTYAHFMDERDDELVLVCRKCHDAIHLAHSLEKYGKRLSRTTDKVLARMRLHPLKEIRRISKKSRRNSRRKDKWQQARKIEESIKFAKSHVRKSYLR